jgi:hypothetical protein
LDGNSGNSSRLVQSSKFKVCMCCFFGIKRASQHFRH